MNAVVLAERSAPSAESQMAVYFRIPVLELGAPGVDRGVLVWGDKSTLPAGESANELLALYSTTKLAVCLFGGCQTELSAYCVGLDANGKVELMKD